MTQTIFMIHGICGGPWVWDKYKSFFEQRGYRCITTTLRFHDMSPGSPPDPELGNTSLVDYADDLEKEIATLDTVPIIMGHSMGGLLTQILGGRGLGKALVMLTPAAPEGIFSIRPTVFRTFFRVMTKWGFWRKPARLSFGAVRYSMLELMQPEERREIYARFVPESGRVTAEIGFWMLDGAHAARVDAAKVTRPVLVIGGSQDRITPAVLSRLVAHKYQGFSTYKEYPNHAHWVLGEPGWSEIAAYVDEWLKHALH